MTPSSLARSAVVIVMKLHQSRPVQREGTTAPLSHPILTHREGAFVKAATPVPELYSVHLSRGRALKTTASWARIFVSPDEPGVRIHDEPDNGFGFSESLTAPYDPAIPAASVEDRLRLYLDWMHGLLLQLGRERGWDLSILEEVHAAVLASPQWPGKATAAEPVTYQGRNGGRDVILGVTPVAREFTGRPTGFWCHEWHDLGPAASWLTGLGGGEAWIRGGLPIRSPSRTPACAKPPRSPWR